MVSSGVLYHSWAVVRDLYRVKEIEERSWLLNEGCGCGVVINEKCADGESEERRVMTLRLINKDNVVVLAISFTICQLHYDFYSAWGWVVGILEILETFKEM